MFIIHPDNKFVFVLDLGAPCTRSQDCHYAQAACDDGVCKLG